MSFIVGILTFLLVVNCLVLILLVLIQLPKKDAGAGLAFGGGAADALFGAGSGNALTKITKYAAVIFFALALLLGYLQDSVASRGNASEFEKQVQQNQTQTPDCDAVRRAATSQPAPRQQTLCCRAADGGHASADRPPTTRRRSNAMTISERARQFFSRARFVVLPLPCFAFLISGCVRREPPADVTIINDARAGIARSGHHRRACRKCASSSGLFEGSDAA